MNKGVVAKAVVALLIVVVLAGVIMVRPKDIGVKSQASFSTEGMLSRAIEANRAKEKNLALDTTKLLYDFTSADDELTLEELNKLFDKSPKGKITTDALLEDVDYFFRIMKYSYGGYQLFGGDDTFSKARVKIDEEVRNIDINDPYYMNEFQKILFNNLSFIKDGHFVIGNKRFHSLIVKDFFSSELYWFLEDKDGYYTTIDDRKYYLKMVNGSSDVESYLKLSINDEGDLMYIFGILNQHGGAIGLDIELYDGSNLVKNNIALYINTHNSSSNLGFKMTEINGIPYIECRRMYSNGREDKSQDDFAESASFLRDKSVSIIDIRGNGGGSDMASMEWFKNYTGKEASSAMYIASILSKTSYHIAGSTLIKLGSEIDQNNKELMLMRGFKQVPIERPIWTSSKRSNVFAKNKNHIFVLIDGEVASSGETFVSFMRNLENVTFVGTNTSGIKLIGNVDEWTMPNSKLNVRAGHTIFYESDGIEEEGVGFMPDIWVDQKHGLHRLVKFIEKTHK